MEDGQGPSDRHQAEGIGLRSPGTGQGAKRTGPETSHGKVSGLPAAPPPPPCLPSTFQSDPAAVAALPVLLRVSQRPVQALGLPHVPASPPLPHRPASFCARISLQTPQRRGPWTWLSPGLPRIQVAREPDGPLPAKKKKKKNHPAGPPAGGC